MMLWVLSFEFGYSHEAHHGFPRFGIRAETRALVFIHVSKIGDGFEVVVDLAFYAS
jgi:hypothetical protein